MSTLVVVTGGFDPVHSGHIAYLNAARRLGDELAVGINSDAWLVRKKGFRFLPFDERQTIIGNLKAVDRTFGFNDDDDSACDAIDLMISYYPLKKIIFANGGDRTDKNIPEHRLTSKYGSSIIFVFGVGGTRKINSSSVILSEYENYIRTPRPVKYIKPSIEIPTSTGDSSLDRSDITQHLGVTEEAYSQMDDAITEPTCPACHPPKKV